MCSTIDFQDLISNSPFRLPYISCDVSSESLILNLIIYIFLYSILQLEILSWSLIGCRIRFTILGRGIRIKSENYSRLDRRGSHETERVSHVNLEMA